MSHPSPSDAGPLHAPGGWQRALREAIRSPAELLATVELDADTFADLEPEFPVLVPRSFAARMRKGDPRDPLLLQVLAQRSERLRTPGFGRDPLGERALSRHGTLKKYAGRALLVTTGACPVHCRYCFRRHFPYAAESAARHRWQDAMDALRGAEDLTEVILSGGDPLSLSNARLSELVARVESLGSVTALRLHTRFPVVLPERVDQGLLALLSRTRLNTVVVVHCNHANEIDDAVRRAFSSLRSAADQLLNQSVLLHGVNDESGRLEALSRSLFHSGVLPYYLHLLDPVDGAAHFNVGEHQGRELIARLRERLPGYLVPRLVREEPGEASKTPVA